MKNRRLILALALLTFCGAAFNSFAGQKTPPQMPEEVVKLLFKDLCKKGCSAEEVARWKSNLKYELHDLNADAVPEFFVFIDHSDWCGAGSNCDYWIFQKKAHGYILLLNDKELRVKGVSSNGSRDLASETPMGFCALNVQRLDATLYKYDGKRYRVQSWRTECRAFTPPAD
jgi:hypothetical protein